MSPKKPVPEDDRTHIGFRVPTKLWSRFRVVAKARMLTATALMRVLMLDAVEVHERVVVEREGGVP